MKKKLFILAIALSWMGLGFAQNPNLDYPTDTIGGVIVYRYPVDRSIGIYRVSVNFGVSQSMVIEWNPFLKDRGLQFGDTLFIPSGRTVVAQTAPVVEPAPATPTVEPTSVVPVADSTPAASVVPVDSTPIVQTPLEGAMNIALLLPLQAQVTKRTETMDRFVDFYEGCLIALQMEQDSLHPVNLYTFDVGKGQADIEQLVLEGKLDSMNAIIGPAYPQQVMVIDSLVKERHIPTLIPFTDNVPTLVQNPSLIRFNATAEQEADSVLDYIANAGDSVNFVLVEGREADIPQNIRYIREGIINRGLPYTVTTFHNIMADSLFLSLKDNVKNIILFNTEKFNNLQIILPHLTTGKQGHQLYLYSHYAWKKEQIVLPQIYATIFASDSVLSKFDYEQAYKLYFDHSHASNNPRFDLLGYDLTRQFLAYLRNQPLPYGLQSDLRLVQEGEGGLINTHITIVNGK